MGNASASGVAGGAHRGLRHPHGFGQAGVADIMLLRSVKDESADNDGQCDDANDSPNDRLLMRLDVIDSVLDGYSNLV